jgi:hypothetical protein
MPVVSRMVVGSSEPGLLQSLRMTGLTANLSSTTDYYDFHNYLLLNS